MIRTRNWVVGLEQGTSAPGTADVWTGAVLVLLLGAVLCTVGEIQRLSCPLLLGASSTSLQCDNQNCLQAWPNCSGRGPLSPRKLRSVLRCLRLN